MLGGVQPLEASIAIHGAPSKVRDVRDASRVGIGFIPEDRKAVGLIQEHSVAFNISLPSLREVSRLGVLRGSAMVRRADDFRSKLNIRTPSVRTQVKNLSGGNQQKVMLAKWLASGVRILAVEEPTHGIDIGAKVQVHDLLRAFAATGGTVVLMSTDVHEVLSVCDRIAVMRHGRLVDVISSEELSHADLAAMGVKDIDHLLETLIETGREKEIA
jgi:ABC-type sugar transport system ATPase subunit